MAFVLASYCIGWQTSCLHSRRSQRHEQNLTNDIRQAIGRFDADIILLSECGTINEGLPPEFEAMLHRIVGPEFDLTHQSHYTAIVRRATVQVIEAPSLKGPLSPLPKHFYRLAQHLKVQIRDSAEMPIDVWNCHSPSSKRYPFSRMVRQHILQYFAINSGPRALIAGDLNSRLDSLIAEFGRYPGFHYCYEPTHQHGDIMIARGVSAHSVPCDVNSASDAHRMCVIALPVPEKLHHLLLVNRLMPKTLKARPPLAMRVCCFLAMILRV